MIYINPGFDFFQMGRLFNQIALFLLAYFNFLLALLLRVNFNSF
jgi:hypothetical protein